MRILHIDKFLTGISGVGSTLRMLGELQRAAGHEVLMFGCGCCGEPPGMPEFTDFARHHNPLLLWRMIHNRDAAAKLAAFLDEHPVDVAHVHNVYHHLTPSIFPVLARHGVGIVMTLHDYRLACPTRHFLRPDGLCMRCLGGRFFHAASPRCAGLTGLAAAIETYMQFWLRRYSRRVHTFICLTNFMREVMVKTGYSAERCEVVRYPIAPTDLPAMSAGDRPMLLYAGRLSSEKSPELMLDLAARLPQADVVIAGSGPLGDELASRVAAESPTNVTLTGPLPPEKMPDYYARASAVILTSRCMENSPLAMLEAMAAGRCVIVPNEPPLREWVADGQTGRLYRRDDVDSLSQVCREIIADPAGRSQMARAGQEVIRKQHDPMYIMSQLETLYEESIHVCASQ